MSRPRTNQVFWFIVALAGIIYHNLVNSLEITNFFIAFLIVIAIIDINTSLIYMEKEYMKEEDEGKITAKDNL